MLDYEKNVNCENKTLIAKASFIKVYSEKKTCLKYLFSFKVKERLDSPFSIKIKQHLDSPFTWNFDYPPSLCAKVSSLSTRSGGLAPPTRPGGGLLAYFWPRNVWL